MPHVCTTYVHAATYTVVISRTCIYVHINACRLQKSRDAGRRDDWKHETNSYVWNKTTKNKKKLSHLRIIENLRSFII